MSVNMPRSLSNRARGLGGRRSRAGGNRPPSISSNVTLSHRYRFTSTSGTATALTPQSIALAAGSMCTVSNTTVQCLFSSVRLKRLTLWAPPSAQGSFVTCSVEWIGFNQANTVEVSDTSNSVATPAYISTSPPPATLAKFWQLSSVTTNLCTVVAPTGTIIDAEVDLIIGDDEAGTSIGVSAGTLGNLYYLSLDPNATHHYVPVSLTTTT